MNPLLLPELLSQIADYIRIEPATRCCRVCKSWNAAFSPIVWRRFTADDETTSNEHVIRGFTRNARCIRQLTYKDLAFVFDLSLLCTQLTELIVQRTKPNASGYSKAENWARLEQLILLNPGLSVNFRGTARDAPITFWTALASCTRIRLCRVQMKQEHIQAFWEGCRSTEELTVLYSRSLDDTDFFAAAQGVYLNLKRFRVDIDHWRTRAMATNIYLFLKKCPNLVGITLNAGFGALFPFLPTFCSLLEQGYLGQLKDLGFPSSTQDDSISACLRAITRVHNLQCNTTRFSTLAFQALMPHFGSLQHLSLSSCLHVDDDMLQTVLESCPSLKELTADRIQASRIQQGRSWVCLGLKKFIVFVAVDGYIQTSEEGGCSQSQAVFGQLSRLAQLEHLFVGKSSIQSTPELVQGLDFRLASGMGQLATLKMLTKLCFENTKQNMCAEDIDWIWRHFWRLVALGGKYNTVDRLHKYQSRES